VIGQRDRVNLELLVERGERLGSPRLQPRFRVLAFEHPVEMGTPRFRERLNAGALAGKVVGDLVMQNDEAGHAGQLS